MPRFTLRNFSTPTYAPYIPENTVEERPAQKVTDLLYFMHTLPWFSESEDEKKRRELKEKYEKDMEEYTPDLDAQDEMAKEAETRHAENQMEGYYPEEATQTPTVEESDYDPNYKAVSDFDYTKATPDEIAEMQSIVGTDVDRKWGQMSIAARDEWLNKQDENAKYSAALRDARQKRIDTKYRR